MGTQVDPEHDTRPHGVRGGSSRSADTAVRLAGVTKRFEDVTAVDGVDLDIADGEFFSLLGPSGCGKTTTLRMIAGLEFPTEGGLQIFGEEMGLRPANKRPVNTVFQSYALFPHMTVAGNVAFGMEMRGVSRTEIRKKVGEVLELVRLGGLGERKPKQLSGGQQQRVALARALVNHPKVLLLDEPLGALDLKLRQAMQTELKSIQEQVGITFVYVTHDQEEALVMSDRIGVMDDGRLLQVGVPEEIYDHPRTRMVADFIGQTNFLSAVVTAPGEVRLPGGHAVKLPLERRGAPATAGTGTGNPEPVGGATGNRHAGNPHAGNPHSGNPHPGHGRAAEWTPDSEIVLTVRPEKMSVLPAGTEAPLGANCLTGTVRRRVFLGSSVSYEVAAGDLTITARQGNGFGLRRFTEGEDVLVTWDPQCTEVVDT